MGNFATAYNALRSQAADLLRDGKFRIVVQHGLTKIRELPDVPLLIDQAKNDEDRRLLEVFLSRQETGKPYFLPPGVPADRVETLRAAFDQTMTDPAFISEVKAANMDVSGPLTGQEVSALVDRAMSTPPSIVARIKRVFGDFINAPR